MALETAQAVRDRSRAWLLSQGADPDQLKFKLPEKDNRFFLWRMAVLSKESGAYLGEIAFDRETGEIDLARTTRIDIMNGRSDLAALNGDTPSAPKEKWKTAYRVSSLQNTLLLGDCEFSLETLPEESVDLVFTSPPYYNARVEYADYLTYEEYLEKMRRVIRACHRALNEGRYFVMNISPVIIRRLSRSESSRRLAVPFDMHALFISEGFDFIDDIIWAKPDGCGWSMKRGLRFKKDRRPLQYKPFPIHEYLLVYRKKTEKLIDWNLRSYPDQKAIEESKVDGDYETTSIWNLAPSRHKEHPATFPVALAERVIRYYSFKTDVVCDPFAGIGTTGIAAQSLQRRFVLCEREPRYAAHIEDSLGAHISESRICEGFDATMKDKFQV